MLGAVKASAILMRRTSRHLAGHLALADPWANHARAPLDHVDQHARRHVALPVAVALAHFELTGEVPDVTRPDWFMRISQDIARALSNVIPIYGWLKSSPMPVVVPAAELIRGRFEHGVQSLRASDGRVFVKLTVVRRALWAGIRELKAAGAGIDAPRPAAAQ